VNDQAPLPADLIKLFTDDGADRRLSGPLPPGRLIRADEGTGEPTMWMTDEPVSADTWARMYADRRRSGLWPLLLGSLPYRRDPGEFRPWTSGELFPDMISSPDLHDPAALMAEWWRQYTEDEEDDDFPQEIERLAPYGRQWPGPAPARAFDGDPDAFAHEYAAHLISHDRSMRLGLVAAARGADALSNSGWVGPANYTNDTAEISAVITDWEDRFGARVIGVGFADLFLSVAAPPADLEEALHIAAEHFAICPDNVDQGPKPYTLAAYAERLIGLNAWSFWWD
jgi:hypothetical protein